MEGLVVSWWLQPLRSITHPKTLRAKYTMLLFGFIV